MRILASVFNEWQIRFDRWPIKSCRLDWAGKRKISTKWAKIWKFTCNDSVKLCKVFQIENYFGISNKDYIIILICEWINSLRSSLPYFLQFSLLCLGQRLKPSSSYIHLSENKKNETIVSSKRSANEKIFLHWFNTYLKNTPFGYE